MSEEIRVVVFDVVKVITVTIDGISKNQIESIHQQIIECITTKLAKMSLFFKNLNMTTVNGLIVINDEYQIHKDLKEIMESFGMIVNPVNLGLKGNTYVVQDSLIQLLNQFEDISTKEFVAESFKLTKEQRAIVSESRYFIDNSTSSLIREVMDKGTLNRKAEIVTKVSEKTVNGRLSSTHSKVVSDSTATIEQQAKQEVFAFNAMVNEELSKYNRVMVSGTTQIIRSRAKAMGYGISEVKKGKTTQLVLVKLG